LRFLLLELQELVPDPFHGLAQTCLHLSKTDIQ
jgi:hypothetical protein